MAITSSLDNDTTTELADLVLFATTMVVKEQEVADSFEPLCLLRCGQTYGGVDQGPPSNWVRTTVYVQYQSSSSVPPLTSTKSYWVYIGNPVPGTGAETATDASGVIWTSTAAGWVNGLGQISVARAGWTFNGQEPQTPRCGVDSANAVWLLSNNGQWTNLASGVEQPNQGSSWQIVDLPATACWVDPLRRAAYTSVDTWIDTTTGTISAGGPALANNQFPNGSFISGQYPVGLSALIPTPQDYVAARLTQVTQSGLLAEGVAAQLTAYVANPGQYTDEQAAALLQQAGGLSGTLLQQSVQVSQFLTVKEAIYVLTQFGVPAGTGTPLAAQAAAYLALASQQPPLSPQALAAQAAPILSALQAIGQAWLVQQGIVAADNLEMAIENFASTGTVTYNAQGQIVQDDRWEDDRQPFFLTDASGSAILDANGNPVPNPLRLVLIPFVGEKNDYYRRLVNDYGIDPFIARTAQQFEIISPGTATSLDAVAAGRYMAAYALCVKVFIACYYEPAYTKDPLYLSWCRLTIAWMAIMRVINERMTGFSDINTLSDWECTNLLYSYGLYDYDDMPLAYKRVFLQNINQIISDKGTTQCFQDIIGMFNLTNELSVFKHYFVKHFPNKAWILRYPGTPAVGQEYRLFINNAEYDAEVVAQVDAPYQYTTPGAALAALAAAGAGATGIATCVPGADGASLVFTFDPVNPIQPGQISGDIYSPYLGAIEGIGTGTTGPTDYTNPVVGFLQVPAGQTLIEPSTMPAQNSFLLDYNSFVEDDPTWRLTYQQAQQLPVSCVETKYFSLQAGIDVAANGLAVSFLWNSLQRAQIEGRAVSLLVPGADTLGTGVATMNLFEAFVVSLIFTLYMFGIDDLIPYGENGIAQVLGARTDGAAFPNEGSLLPYSTTLGIIENYPGQLTNSEITGMVIGNINIANQVRNSAAAVGKSAGSWTEFQTDETTYTTLDRLWDFKFIATMQTAVWNGAVRYSDWLALSNPALAAWAASVDAASESNPTALPTAILEITSLVEQAVGNNTFNFALAFGATDLILAYVKRMILFFKSYTAELHDFEYLLTFADPNKDGLHLVNNIPNFGVENDLFFSDGATGGRSEKSWMWDLRQGTTGSWGTGAALASERLVLRDVWAISSNTGSTGAGPTGATGGSTGAGPTAASFSGTGAYTVLWSAGGALVAAQVTGLTGPGGFTGGGSGGNDPVGGAGPADPMPAIFFDDFNTSGSTSNSGLVGNGWSTNCSVNRNSSSLLLAGGGYAYHALNPGTMGSIDFDFVGLGSGAWAVGWAKTLAQAEAGDFDVYATFYVTSGGTQNAAFTYPNADGSDGTTTWGPYPVTAFNSGVGPYSKISAELVWLNNAGEWEIWFVLAGLAFYTGANPGLLPPVGAGTVGAFGFKSLGGGAALSNVYVYGNATPGMVSPPPGPPPAMAASAPGLRTWGLGSSPTGTYPGTWGSTLRTVP